jgi:ribosomal protein L16/L10AE
MDPVIAILDSVLRIAAATAPSVVSALTGGQTVDEAIEAARVAAEKLPVRTGPSGQWTRDLAERKARIPTP